MKKVNDTLNNMTKEELEMAIREQDRVTIETLTKAIMQQQEFSEKQNKLLIKLQETVTIVGETMVKENNVTKAKIEAIVQTIDGFEKMIESMGFGDIAKQLMRTMSK